MHNLGTVDGININSKLYWLLFDNATFFKYIILRSLFSPKTYLLFLLTLGWKRSHSFHLFITEHKFHRVKSYKMYKRVQWLWPKFYKSNSFMNFWIGSWILSAITKYKLSYFQPCIADLIFSCRKSTKRPQRENFFPFFLNSQVGCQNQNFMLFSDLKDISEKCIKKLRTKDHYVWGPWFFWKNIFWDFLFWCMFLKMFFISEISLKFRILLHSSWPIIRKNISFAEGTTIKRLKITKK